MALDTFICGTCMVSFNDIEQFILHKNELCSKPSASQEGNQALEAGGTTQVNEITNLVHIPSSDNMTMAVTDEHGNVVSTSVSLPGSESLLANTGTIYQGENQQTVIILQGDLPTFNLESAEQIFTEVKEDKANMEMLAGLYKKKGRSGRPRKVKSEPKVTAIETKEKNIPEIGEDGKLLCTRCKKSFTRERVFNAHKCAALSEYLDFTVKEGLTADPDDNHMPQDDLDDAGALDQDFKDAEYKMPPLLFKKHNNKHKRRKMTTNHEPVSITCNPDGNEMAQEGDAVKMGVISDADGHKSTSEAETAALIRNAVPVMSEDGSVSYLTGSQDGQDESSLGQIPVCQVKGGPDIDESHVKETDQIGTLPLDLSEEEKCAFEAALNVDLSGVDSMFRVHCIEQELNSNVSQLSRFSSNTLSLYSCNTCDKVFKSLSHMRFHVLIHTELRPFKCIKCNYSSNARGNLYTHIRKHTGQYYKCEQSGCKFKTVNKSHLIEHSMIHTGEKHQCDLCRKLYNTQKSLMSHIRKYHDNIKGREYLSKFMQGRDVRGSTVIHQCHVCNRKFKKKTDRDRHLFVHDIKDLPVIKHCYLCDYSAARNKYLEKHFQKHRNIYRCCKCKEMYLSSIKLVEHLTTNHVDTTDTESWEKLFEESIMNSLYLPEPDQIMSEEEKSLVNLPSELSESSIYQMKLQNSGEDELASKLINGADVFINKVPAVTVEENNTEEKSTLPDENDNNFDTYPEVENAGSEMNNEHIVDNALHNEETTNDTSFTAEETDAEDKTNADIDGETKADIAPSETAETKLEVTDDQENVIESGEAVEKSDTDILKEAAESATTAVVEETNLTDDDILGIQGNASNCSALIEKLGYLPMTLEIFQKMRDTFGSEECEYCGRLFFSRADYEPHVRTHTGDKPHVCQVCGFRAITKDNLKRHIDKEHEKISYSCRECSYVASTRTQLWNHSMTHKGLKGLECPVCQNQYNSIKELKEHAQVAHPTSNTDELDKILSYKHKAQGKLGRRSYKCPHCNKVFLRASSELQKHIWIHEGIKPFKCPLCTYACRSKNNLQAHMLRHSKEKPFTCWECGKAYKSKTALRWHVRSHDGKLFKCDKCPYEATQKSHLKRHMETHEVIKKFVCGECKFSANTLGFLKVHYARFHKNINIQDIAQLGSAPIEVSQEVNTFKCISCDYLFGNLTDLKRHLRTRHHMNVQEIQKVHDSQGNVSEVQVVQVEDSSHNPVTMEVIADGTQSQIVTDENLDEKTASAVNILQQIIGMSQNGSLAGAQQINGSSVLQMNPETIIVQQDGSQMYVSAENTTEIDGNQYVIQYIPQAEEGTGEEAGMRMIEVQEDTVEAEVLGDAADMQSEIVTTT